MSVRQAIRRALGLLSPRDRRLLGISIAIQMSTSVLDLVGVLLIGVVGALAVTTVQSQPPPAPLTQAADALGLGALSPQALVVVLSAIAALVFVTKSVVSSYLTRRVFIFLANRQALVSARLAKELFSRPLTFVLQRSSQETAYALIGGVSYATSQILGQMVVAATEIALLTVLGVALLFISPLIALGSIVFFLLIAIAMQRLLGGWAARMGERAMSADVASFNTIQEALGAYREVIVTNRRALYVDRIQALRWEAARVSANSQFIGVFPKYVFEASLVVGGFLLAGVLFSTQGSVEAVGTLALFLAAGSRVMPSLLRLQGATLTMRGAAGGATAAFELAADLDDPLDDPRRAPSAGDLRAQIRIGNPDFLASIDLADVSVTYPGSSRPAVSSVTLRVPPGGSVALVGRSGAGKSTLADLILGVLAPDSGQALIGGESPTIAVARWPGGIAYVPQDVILANGSIRDNVALGLPSDAIDDDMVWESLDRAHLAQHVGGMPAGLDTQVGERGVRLSGGQRQRLGLARALYTRPHLLVLDEATSALDAETESAITQTFAELGGHVTTVVIAHRLSTVRNLDLLVYLEDGSVIDQGPFDKLLKTIPTFRRQATLMGIEG